MCSSARVKVRLSNPEGPVNTAAVSAAVERCDVRLFRTCRKSPWLPSLHAPFAVPVNIIDTVAPITQYIENILLLLYSRQPSPHVLLMLFMKMGKEVTRLDGLSFQPRKMAGWVVEHFIG